MSSDLKKVSLGPAKVPMSPPTEWPFYADGRQIGEVWRTAGKYTVHVVGKGVSLGIEPQDTIEAALNANGFTSRELAVETPIPFGL